MIFWMCLIIESIFGLIAIIGDYKLPKMVYNIFVTISVIGFLATFTMLPFIISNHIGINAKIASYQERYNSLVYQVENNLYENDNDLGKKELVNQIQHWNEDVASRKEMQNDFWIGIFYPNIYDQFETIPLDIIK